ncbi:MAG: HAMP domain-containing protein [Rubellimicrobium sp.]|nr:HAMP domain-containing protein [Rubellimicrobium sp.]
MPQQAPPDPDAPVPARGLKRRMWPRGLYGRAALILVVPVVALQLVVSLAFIQRHFEGVTRQMTGNIADEIALVIAEDARDRDAAAQIGAALGLRIIRPAPPLAGGDGRAVWDLSGRIVAQVLVARLPELQALSLEGGREVVLHLRGQGDEFGISFPRSRVSASNPHQLLVLMIVFGAAMTFIAYLFLRNQLRPIARLARAAEAYGRGVTLPYQPRGAREVRAAGLAFLRMRERIREQNASRALMLSGVSHDLRTPLTRLRLGLAMIAGDEADGLRRDVDEMERMIATFLDFARGDAGEAAGAVDLVALAGRVVEDAARGGGPVVLRPVAGQPVPVQARPLALRRAIGNLVGNARRYGTRVEVSVAFAPGRARITVEDNGPGIAAGDRADALRPFVRLDDARNQDRGAGVGLGLAIVAEIARTQGGELRLGQSARLGGLAAELVLPV